MRLAYETVLPLDIDAELVEEEKTSATSLLAAAGWKGMAPFKKPATLCV